MIFKVKVLFTIVSLLLVVGPSAAADFTYQEYTKAPEPWKRGFVFGISRYLAMSLGFNAVVLIAIGLYVVAAATLR